MPEEGRNTGDIEFLPDQGAVEEIAFDQIDEKSTIIDVRSPGEFHEDHIPGSLNVPLLDDQERGIVGAMYRKDGKDTATQWALRKLLQRAAGFLEDLQEAMGSDSSPIICCSRGGDRSRNVTQFLTRNEIQARRLAGGYRSYRKNVIHGLSEIDIDRFWILDGLTGSGKTAVLQKIASQHPDRVLDLESYAEHRSSVLGDVGKSPSSQKKFESLLHAQIKSMTDSAPWILIEGESRKVGNRHIPEALWKKMATAPRIELIRDRQSRARLLVDEYTTSEGWQPVIDRVEGLRSYTSLGDAGVDEVQALLREDKPVEAAMILLEKHYDPRYLHGSNPGRFRMQIEQCSVDEAAQQLVSYLEKTTTAFQ